MALAAPSSAAPAADEYAALTRGCGLLDVSERGKFALTGPDAKAFMHGQVTNDIAGLTPGSGCYAAFLTHKGKMRGDLRVLDLGAELFVDCERSVLQTLFTMVHRYKLGRDVELHKRTLERGLLSLIGPLARAVAGAEALPGTEHASAPAEIGGAAVTLVSTFAGVDVICDSADTATVTEALLAKGAAPVSEAAVEVIRVEQGRPRYGLDLDDSVIPQEADLNARAVSFTKGCYVGQETVARLFYKGKPNRHLRGLELSAPVPSGTPVRHGEREIGSIGSAVVSPAHGPIALALLRREAQPGDTVAVGAEGVTATVRALPFAAGAPPLASV